MSPSLAAILAPPELPQVHCAKCGKTAKLVAFDRQGAPLFACADPECKHKWKGPTPR